MVILVEQFKSMVKNIPNPKEKSGFISYELESEIPFRNFRFFRNTSDYTKIVISHNISRFIHNNNKITYLYGFKIYLVSSLNTMYTLINVSLRFDEKLRHFYVTSNITHVMPEPESRTSENLIIKEKIDFFVNFVRENLVIIKKHKTKFLEKILSIVPLEVF